MSVDQIIDYENGVTVVIPIRNSSSYISKTVDSVIEAVGSYQYEILLVDDFSDDIDIIEDIFRDSINISILKKEIKSNASVSRNLGIKSSRFRFVFLLDSDDMFSKEYISKRIDYMHKTLSGVYFGPFKDYDDNVNYKICRTEYKTYDIRDYIFISNGDFRSSTISIDKKYFKGTLFDTLQNKHQDWGFAIRCNDAGESVSYDADNPNVLICKGRHTQMSSVMNIDASKYFIGKYLYDDKYILSFIKKHLLLALLNKDFDAYFFFSTFSVFPSIIESNIFYKTIGRLLKIELIRRYTPFLISFLCRVYIRMAGIIKG